MAGRYIFCMRSDPTCSDRIKVGGDLSRRKPEKYSKVTTLPNEAEKYMNPRKLHITVHGRVD
jgi:hypothetical protein